MAGNPVKHDFPKEQVDGQLPILEDRVSPTPNSIVDESELTMINISSRVAADSQSVNL